MAGSGGPGKREAGLTLAEMLAVSMMSELLDAVGSHLAAKKRKQAKNRRAQAARKVRS